MTNTILPCSLPAALDGYSGLKLLSLDCFDTLVWRETNAPRDVFAALPGVNVPQRQWAEQRARSAAALRHRRNEVGIADIYRELLPNGSAHEQAAAVAAELDAEARLCFGFEPTIELMREAKRRGIGVVIVSDTYLDEAQLRNLIARAAGEDVAALIDRLFCSSVHGRSKGEGLFEIVLGAVDAAPQEILHIGDNKAADVDGVAPFGVHTLHLKQFGEVTEQRLRLEAAVSAMLHAGSVDSVGTMQPHRAALALGEPQIEDGAAAFGFATLGPILHGFQRWLDQEALALKAERGGTVHRLFLMRDGYLPQLIHEAGGNSGHAVEISRFTSTAASFVDAAAVERYLQNEIGGDLRAVAKQLLLPPAEIVSLFKQLPAVGAPAAFLRAVREPARMRRILKNSNAFAERLIEHVRARVNPAPGDTLMLADLGYNGSVQNEVEPLLRQAFGCHVAGRYLLLREQSLTGLDKAGLIGHDRYDAYTLEALCSNVAVIEQLCTATQGSVVDYRPNGDPIRRDNSIKSRQCEIRDRVQTGALRFAHIAPHATVRASSSSESVDMWRLGAAAALGRLMFMPMQEELTLLRQFEHDVNLGVDNTVALFDPAIAKRGLRQRGLFYMKGSERMYLPAELHGEGLSLKLSLLAHKRFGLALKYCDFVDRTIALPVIIADGKDVSTGTITATPTHDGYYLAPIPIGDSRLSVGIQFGQLYDWVQIDSAVFMPVDRFLSEKQRPGAEERAAMPTLEGMEQTAPHLFHCADEFGFMMVPPPPRVDDRPIMLALVFRPIAMRQVMPSVEARAAA